MMIILLINYMFSCVILVYIYIYIIYPTLTLHTHRGRNTTNEVYTFVLEISHLSTQQERLNAAGMRTVLLLFVRKDVFHYNIFFRYNTTET